MSNFFKAVAWAATLLVGINLYVKAPGEYAEVEYIGAALIGGSLGIIGRKVWSDDEQ